MQAGDLVSVRGRSEIGLVTKAPYFQSAANPVVCALSAKPSDPAAFMRGRLKYRSRFMRRVGEGTRRRPYAMLSRWRGICSAPGWTY